MTANPRTWLIGGVIASVLLALVGWLTVISPRMQAVAQTRDEAVELEGQSQVVMAQVRQLQQQAQDLPEQVAALERIQQRIPSSVDVPALLRDIQRSAAVHNVKVDSLTPGEITVFSSTQENPAGTTSGSSGTGDPVATPDSTGPAPQETPTELGQGALPDGVGLSYVPITVTATGDFQDLRAFTASIEELQRAYLVTGVQLARASTGAATTTPATSGSELSMTLDTRVFLASDRLRNLPDQAREQVGGQ